MSELILANQEGDLTGLEGNFLAVDMTDGRRLVGTLLKVIKTGKTSSEPRFTLQLPNEAVVTERLYKVQMVWHAPMGYRPPSTMHYGPR